MYYLLGQMFASEHSETAFASKAFAESLGFVLSQAVLALMPVGPLYPTMAALWTLPIIAWYSRWKLPVHLLHSKSKQSEDEEARKGRENDVTDHMANIVWHH